MRPGPRRLPSRSGPRGFRRTQPGGPCPVAIIYLMLGVDRHNKRSEQSKDALQGNFKPIDKIFQRGKNIFLHIVH